MKALIIGAAGFVGRYLINELVNNGYEVTATKLPNETLYSENCEIADLDILVENNISVILEKSQPDIIFHLAALSSVALSWKKPALTLDINIKGALNLLEAVKNLNYKARVLLIGSGEEYGKVSEAENPINESNKVCPVNIYAASKACQAMIGKIYTDAYNMNVIMVRAFNHIGPGQSPDFVVSDFCKQVAEIEKGIVKPVIYVGNLDAKRDFTDVRDVVRAYRLLSVNGERGEIYNIGSGKAIEVKKILELIVNHSNAAIKIELDQSKYRPVDVPVIEADIKKITACTGWKPEIDLNVTIFDTLRFWRNKIN
jgi:GDP-4-dehydro-6-deoxy-D-mannose reductase